MAVQKRYKVKNVTTGAMEEVYAFNDNEVIESYKIVGHEVKILGTVELPGAIGGADDPDPSHPNAGNMMPIPPGGIPQQAPPGAPMEMKFSASGMDFKMTPDGVYVKTWVDIKDAEYKILSRKTGKETSDYRVQVKDWVRTENPDEEAKTVEEEPKVEDPRCTEDGEKIIG